MKMMRFFCVALLEPMIKMMRFWAGSGVFIMIPGAESTFLHSKLMMSWTEPDNDDVYLP